ncbi:hypothetical protein [Nocardia jiangxiensis]|uniref:hypothetical protein n=1 Tax=Nocardia jiangxiensis TaxID=282685 RepID=UPI00030E5012|nr:hypothetical protein [Nocardia jiangxiensis]
MRTPKFAAITMLAIAATTITYSVAAADPASAAAPTTLISPVTASGTDHGVGFSMRRDGNAVALDVTGGTLRLDDRTVTMLDTGRRDRGLPCAEYAPIVRSDRIARVPSSGRSGRIDGHEWAG